MDILNIIILDIENIKWNEHILLIIIFGGKAKQISENETKRNSYVTKITEDKVFFILSNNPKFSFQR